MEVTRNLRILEELDNQTAVTIIQLALEELSQLLESDEGTYQQGTNSEARRRLERQRDELQRQFRRRGRTAVATGGQASFASTRRAPEPVNTQPQQERTNETLTSGGPSTSMHQIPGAWPSPPLPPQPPTAAQQPPGVRTSRRQDEPSPQTMCHICRDDYILAEVVTLTCRHHCCRECLNELYRGATADESRYPPRCCANQPLALEQSRPLINAQILRDFLEKKVEWDTQNRTYCSNRNCGSFILPGNIRGKDARCARCRTRTCAECKRAAHDVNTPCGNDGELQGALRLLERNRWRRCEGCGNGIERTYGCNHMACTCGRQFCYQCGAQWLPRECQCPLFPDNMVENPNEQAVPPNLGAHNPNDEWERFFLENGFRRRNQLEPGGEWEDIDDFEPLIQNDLLEADGEWEDFGNFVSLVERDRPFGGEVDQRHEQELEESRRRRNVQEIEEDRQREELRELELDRRSRQVSLVVEDLMRNMESRRLQDGTNALQRRLTQERRRADAIRGPRLNREQQQTLREMDGDIRELADELVARQLQLDLIN